MYEDMGKRDAPALDVMEATSETYFRTALVYGSYRSFVAETGDAHVVAGGGIVIGPWPAHPSELQARRATILNAHRESVPASRHCSPPDATMMEWLKAQGFPKVSLHASDEGRPLYESLGFEISNEMELKL